jgi:hypothetical protein
VCDNQVFPRNVGLRRIHPLLVDIVRRFMTFSGVGGAKADGR